MPESKPAKQFREYETIFLLKPDLTDENVDRVRERVRGIINREGGKVLRFTVWGKKRTMYPIAKQARAIYVHAHYLGHPGLVSEVERNLHNLDEVTRYMSVKIADEVDPESRPALDDIKLAGDVDEARAPGPEREEFRPPELSEESQEMDEESMEEA